MACVSPPLFAQKFVTSLFDSSIFHLGYPFIPDHHRPLKRYLPNSNREWGRGKKKRVSFGSRTRIVLPNHQIRDCLLSITPRSLKLRRDNSLDESSHFNGRAIRAVPLGGGGRQPKPCRSMGSMLRSSKKLTPQPQPSLEDGERTISINYSVPSCPRAFIYSDLVPTAVQSSLFLSSNLILLTLHFSLIRLLLKYVSRDELELRGSGTGGLPELRDAVAAHEISLQSSQDSQPKPLPPLFGFLHYRRRKVVLKYQPENCSQLVQARATVHFMAVCETFSPHDTSSFSSPRDLRDTKLSAACSLHAASGSSSSSSSSLRRRRLVEITEEEGEDEDSSRNHQSPQDRERPNKRRSTGPSYPISSNGPPEPWPSTTPVASVPSPPVILNANLAASPTERRFASSGEPPLFIGTQPQRPPSPTSFIEAAPRRMSSQSVRPDLHNLHYGSHNSRQKVRLVPRPSLDVSGRPRTAAGNFRPVSQLPAGLKPFSKAYSAKPSSSPSAANHAPHENGPLPPRSDSLTDSYSRAPELDTDSKFRSNQHHVDSRADTSSSTRPTSSYNTRPTRPHTSSGDSYVRHGNGSHPDLPHFPSAFAKPAFLRKRLDL